MDSEKKLEELVRIAEIAGDMPMEEFNFTGLFALAYTLTKNEEGKYEEFIETFEKMVASKK